MRMLALAPRLALLSDRPASIKATTKACDMCRGRAATMTLTAGARWPNSSLRIGFIGYRRDWGQGEGNVNSAGWTGAPRNPCRPACGLRHLVPHRNIG